MMNNKYNQIFAEAIRKAMQSVITYECKYCGEHYTDIDGIDWEPGYCSYGCADNREGSCYCHCGNPPCGYCCNESAEHESVEMCGLCYCDTPIGVKHCKKCIDSKFLDGILENYSIEDGAANVKMMQALAMFTRVPSNLLG